MRSIFAATAAIWFIYNALAFVPQGGGVYPNPGAAGGLDGDLAAVALTWAARSTFIGLALIAASLVEWRKLLDLFRAPRSPDPRETRMEGPAQDLV